MRDLIVDLNGLDARRLIMWRWANQFTQPDGSNPIDAMTIEPVDADREVQLVTTTGTYNGGMTMGTAPAEPSPGWMLLGGIVMGPDAPWFFKLTGPEPTLREQREAFLTLLRSARPATQ